MRSSQPNLGRLIGVTPCNPACFRQLCLAQMQYGLPHEVRQADNCPAAQDRPRFVLCGTGPALCSAGQAPMGGTGHIALCLGIVVVALAAVSSPKSSEAEPVSSPRAFFLLEIIPLVGTMNNPRTYVVVQGGHPTSRPGQAPLCGTGQLQGWERRKGPTATQATAVSSTLVVGR